MAEYRTSIEIAAPPDTVFDYLTTATGLTAWMGTFADLDPQPGGHFTVDIAGHPIRGNYLHVERPTRVVVSWGVAGSADLPAGSSRVEFRLTPIDSGTRVELTHSDLPEAALAGHADGWAHFLPRLEQVSRGEPPVPDTWRPLPDAPSAT